MTSTTSGGAALSSSSGGPNKRKRTSDGNDEAADVSGGGNGGVSLSSLEDTLVQLRSDLDLAHARIDALVSLLREKVANPLLRGLDRAGGSSSSRA